MAEFPALPLFTDAYIADTDHLSDQEHGLYIKLLIAMWRSPQCRLPDDDEWLARKFRRDANAVRTDMRPLIAEFCECNGGWITQKRLAKEWAWCMKKREKNSVSAKARWNKDSDSCERSASLAVRTECPPPHPNPVKQKVKKPPSAGGVMSFETVPTEWVAWAAQDRGWGADVIYDVWSQFKDYWTDGKGKSTKRTDWEPTWPRQRWDERFPGEDVLTEWVNAKEVKLPPLRSREGHRVAKRIRQAESMGRRFIASERVVFVVGDAATIVTVMRRSDFPALR